MRSITSPLLRTLLPLPLTALAAATARAQVYVSTTSNIAEYTYSDAFVRNVASGLTYGYNLSFGPDGLLYVADDGAGAVKKYNPDTGAFLGSVISGLNRTTSAKFGPDGNLYVSEYNNNRVLKVNALTGTVLQAYTGINSVIGLQFMPDGDLLATEGNSGGRIRRINTTTGAVTTFLTSTNIADVHLLPSGDYVFTDRNGAQLHRTTSAGGSFVNFTTASVPSFPYFMDTTDTTLYVGSATNGVYRYDLSTGSLLGTFGASNASGVAIRPSVGAAPEPSALALLLLPAAGAVVLRRRSSHRC